MKLEQVVKEKRDEAVRRVTNISAPASCCGTTETASSSCCSTGSLRGAGPITRDLSAPNETTELPKPAVLASLGSGPRSPTWLREAFRVAAARQSAAVMIIAQANPGWDGTDATRAPLRDPKTLAETDSQPDGFQEYLVALRDEVIAFRRPVAYVHGDSHYHRVDKPFLDSLGRRLENFTRVETFGDNQANGANDVNWLRVTIDPRSREVFSYQAQIVPANRTAVPAP